MKKTFYILIGIAVAQHPLQAGTPTAVKVKAPIAKALPKEEKAPAFLIKTPEPKLEKQDPVVSIPEGLMPTKPKLEKVPTPVKKNPGKTFKKFETPSKVVAPTIPDPSRYKFSPDYLDEPPKLEKVLAKVPPVMEQQVPPKQLTDPAKQKKIDEMFPKPKLLIQDMFPQPPELTEVPKKPLAEEQMDPQKLADLLDGSPKLQEFNDTPLSKVEMPELGKKEKKPGLSPIGLKKKLANGSDSDPGPKLEEQESGPGFSLDGLKKKLANGSDPYPGPQLEKQESGPGLSPDGLKKKLADSNEDGPDASVFEDMLQEAPGSKFDAPPGFPGKDTGPDFAKFESPMKKTPQATADLLEEDPVLAKSETHPRKVIKEVTEPWPPKEPFDGGLPYLEVPISKAPGADEKKKEYMQKFYQALVDHGLITGPIELVKFDDTPAPSEQAEGEGESDE